MEQVASASKEVFPLHQAGFEFIGRISTSRLCKSRTLSGQGIYGPSIYQCPWPMDVRLAEASVLESDAAPHLVVPVRGRPQEYAKCRRCKDWIQWEFLIICRWCGTGPYCQFHNYCAIRHCRRKCYYRPDPQLRNHYRPLRDDYYHRPWRNDYGPRDQ